jgi:hypothetical protein
VRFAQEDLSARPVPAGRYAARILAVRETRSRRGNPMVTVTLALQDCKRELVDYFVTGGVSPSALAVSRRRLATLCRACGIEPKPDEDLDLRLLRDRFVEAEVIVEAGETGPWNRVARYRPPAPPSPA